MYWHFENNVYNLQIEELSQMFLSCKEYVIACGKLFAINCYLNSVIWLISHISKLFLLKFLTIILWIVHSQVESRTQTTKTSTSGVPTGSGGSGIARGPAFGTRRTATAAGRSTRCRPWGTLLRRRKRRSKSWSGFQSICSARGWKIIAVLGVCKLWRHFCVLVRKF